MTVKVIVMLAILIFGFAGIAAMFARDCRKVRRNKK